MFEFNVTLYTECKLAVFLWNIDHEGFLKIHIREAAASVFIIYTQKRSADSKHIHPYLAFFKCWLIINNLMRKKNKIIWQLSFSSLRDVLI